LQVKADSTPILLDKFKLEELKFGSKCKTETKKFRWKIFASLEFDFFRVQFKFSFGIR